MAASIPKLLDFMLLIGRLKSTRRTGWVRRNVPSPESIADHMYRMSIMSFIIDPATGVSKDRCVKLALVHDMAEAIVGDLTPADGVSKQEKHRQEKEAMNEIGNLVDGETAEELKGLWQEYEDQDTPEAKYVKDLDRFDMILQAYEYEQAEGKPGKLQEFFDSTRGGFRNEQVKAWVKELEERREKTLQS